MRDTVKTEEYFGKGITRNRRYYTLCKTIYSKNSLFFKVFRVE